MNISELNKILDTLQSGDISYAISQRGALAKECQRILNLQSISEEDKSKLVLLVKIGNTSYENYPNTLLPIEDGLYDLINVRLQKEDYEAFKVGSKPVHVENPKLDSDVEKVEYPFFIPTAEQNKKLDDLLFPEILEMSKPVTRESTYIPPFTISNAGNISKRLRNTEHVFPELVGTLDKCKFVLDSQAIEKGRYNDDNVRIFERDFMAPLLQSGTISQYDEIVMVGTLKCDGVSVEAEVTDRVISARTRGDTDLDEASDLTPIFSGYKFPAAGELQFSEPIGMKFEAVITKPNIARLNALLGTKYINGRTAIIGILGRSDACLYRDYITLIPIQAAFTDGTTLDRITELEFLNKYYTTSEYMRYTVFRGTFNQVMFMIKTYVEEAEFVRSFIPYMYDGVVIEFFDDDIRRMLGRKNHINQYAMAIKFNPLKKQTVFRGYSYTIGKNGLITPMIYYDPIEFFGAIHDHSTGSSYNRFMKLNLHVGDIIDVEYTNDVMPYVEKPDNEHNAKNAMSTPAEEFPTHCPCCGTKLVMSGSNKSVFCPNFKCREVVKQRLAGMMSNLKLVGFAEESIASLTNIGSFRDLMEATEEDFKDLGPTNKTTLYNMIQEMKTAKKRPDYILLGALGFSNIAATTWKKILSCIPLVEIHRLWMQDKNVLRDTLANTVNGIGPITADTIATEYEAFFDDIDYILSTQMYIQTPIGQTAKAKVRLSGFRDPALCELLQVKGIDASDSNVTRDTTLLLVPTVTGNPTSKVKNAMKFGIPIVPVSEFKANIDKYLEEWGAV